MISLIKSLPLIITTFRDSIKSMKGGKNTNTARTAQDLPMQMILFGIVAMILIIWVVPAIPVTLLGAAIIVVFGRSCRKLQQPGFRYGYRYTSDCYNVNQSKR